MQYICIEKGQGYFTVGEFCTARMWYRVFSQIISLALAWLQDCVLFSDEYMHSTDTNTPWNVTMVLQ